MQNAIEINSITKSFRVYYDKGSSLKEKVLFQNRNRYEKRIVLNNISFNVKKGEAVGLIGQNGCGKSTTLKLINKIIYPDIGTITTSGRISSLIELGAGFHPDMTGRENIYTNASIFGLTRKEITERLEAIISFSEMDQFLDNPVRTYSSGMYMRLAFSVAINVDADILLIDEILGVGDISFQTKCFEKLREIKAKGTTIVIVSHSLGQLEQICDRSIWFDNGKIREDGIPKFVHEHYLYTMEEKRLQKVEQEYQNVQNEKKSGNISIPASCSTKAPAPSNASTNAKEVTSGQDSEDVVSRYKGSSITWCGPNAIRRGDQKAYFTDAYLTDIAGKKKKVFQTGEKLIMHLFYSSHIANLEANVGYAIYRDDGLYCYGTNCIFELGAPVNLKQKGELTIQMPSLSLLPNKYTFDIAIQSPNGIEYDNICFAIELQVMMNKRDTGVSRINNIWSIQ